MSDESESVLVKLTRMEGKLDLSNMRHDQTEATLRSHDTRISTQGERIGGLESRERERAGEVRGATNTVKAVWVVIGGGGMAVVAAIARALNV